MSAFEKARKVETKARNILTPLLHERSGGRYVETDKGRLAIKFQKEYGDVFANSVNGDIIAIEIS